MALLNNGVKSYNPNTLTPPVIYLKGEKIGCLSKNVNLTNRVDPDVLNDLLQEQQIHLLLLSLSFSLYIVFKIQE